MIALSLFLIGFLIGYLMGMEYPVQHTHKWTYTESLTGWTIARCKCGEVEIG